jgi:glycosyltransferase involved in cell wall biosynthesis
VQILHVIRTVDPAIGGPPTIATRIAAGQAGLGHEVSLATYGQPERQPDIDKALAAVPHFDSVGVHPLPRPRGPEWLLPRDTRRDLARLVGEADVVHLHNVWQPILLAAARECRRRKRPYVVMLNGNLDPWSLGQKPWKKKLALLVAVRRMLDGAAALHVGNEAEKELVRPLALAAPATIIPNGVFFEEIEPLPERGTFRESRPVLQSRRFLLFLGRLHHKKGLDVLAEAFACLADRHPDVDLVVVGPDDGARGPFEKTMTELRLRQRVHMLGSLFGAEKYAALVDAECFCLPSRQEGFSAAVIEALACGTPVVISKGCHFPEVAEAGAGAVVDLDSATVAAAIDRVISDADLRGRQRLAARRLVAERYTWPAVAQQTVDLYRGLLESGG